MAMNDRGKLLATPWKDRAPHDLFIKGLASWHDKPANGGRIAVERGTCPAWADVPDGEFDAIRNEIRRAIG